MPRGFLNRLPVSPLRRRTLVDDRGRPYLPISPADVRAAAGKPEVDWSFTLPMLILVGFLSLLFCIFSGLMVSAFVTISKQGPIGLPIAVGVAAGGGYMVVMWMRARARRRFEREESSRKASLARALCPCCACKIEQIPSESDGCTLCPRCHHAWRLP